MPINFSQLLLQPGPSRPLDMPDMSAIAARREQMRLQREQFAEQKRQHAETLAFQQMREQNEMARANLVAENAERAREAAVSDARTASRAADRTALTLKRQAAGVEFTKAIGEGREQEAKAMIPYLASLGSGAVKSGETWRYIPDVIKDRDERELRMGQEAMARRAPGGEAAPEQAPALPPPPDLKLQDVSDLRLPGIPGLEQAPPAPELRLQGEPELPGETEPEVPGEAEPELRDVRPAWDQGPAMQLPGAPELRRPEVGELPPGLQPGPSPVGMGAPPAPPGALPPDVIDMAEMERGTLAQLRPGLQSLVKAYPGEAGNVSTHLGSAEETAKGVLAMKGLPLEKRLELYDKMRGGPDSAINSILAADAAKERQKAQQQKPMTRLEERRLQLSGYKTGEASYVKQGVKDMVASIESADEIVRMVSNADTYDDEKVVNYLMMLAKNKGHQSETDAARMTGLATASTIQQALEWFHERFAGGFGPELQESLIGYAQAIRQKEMGKTTNWYREMKRKARSGDPKVAEGYQEFIDNNVPEYIRGEADAEDEEGTPAGSPEARAGVTVGDEDYETELILAASEADLNPEFMQIVMGKESDGDPTAKSSQNASGTMQIMPENLPAGMTPEKFRKLSAVEQLPYNIKYLTDRGINRDSTPEDYAMAVAAPAFMKAKGTDVVYKKGSLKWEANKPWRPDDDGDITRDSILRFYGLRSDAEANAKAGEAAAVPEPKTPEEQELYDALHGGGK